MRRLAAVLLAGAALLALTGCAPNPDVTGLDADLAALDGVNGADVAIQHPGAPWNTKVVVRLFVDDAAQEPMTRAVLDAARIFAEHAATARHGADIILVDGDIDDYADPVYSNVDIVVLESDGREDSFEWSQLVSVVLGPLMAH